MPGPKRPRQTRLGLGNPGFVDYSRCVVVIATTVAITTTVVLVVIATTVVITTNRAAAKGRLAFQTTGANRLVCMHHVLFLLAIPACVYLLLQWTIASQARL